MTHSIESSPQTTLAAALLHSIESMTPQEVIQSRNSLGFVALAALLEGASTDEALQIAREQHTNNQALEIGTSDGIEGTHAFKVRKSSTPWRGM